MVSGESSITPIFLTALHNHSISHRHSARSNPGPGCQLMTYHTQGKHSTNQPQMRMMYSTLSKLSLCGHDLNADTIGMLSRIETLFSAELQFGLMLMHSRGLESKRKEGLTPHHVLDLPVSGVYLVEKSYSSAGLVSPKFYSS